MRSRTWITLTALAVSAALITAAFILRNASILFMGLAILCLSTAALAGAEA